jgi:DNA polymerase-4
VQPHRARKSYGKETTLDTDIDDTSQMLDILQRLANRVVDGLHRENHQGLTLTLKVKYHDFQSVTRSVTLPEPIRDVDVIMKNVKALLANTDAGKKKVRLLGVSVSNFLGLHKETDGWVQMPLPFKVKG